MPRIIYTTGGPSTSIAVLGIRIVNVGPADAAQGLKARSKPQAVNDSLWPFTPLINSHKENPNSAMNMTGYSG